MTSQGDIDIEIGDRKEGEAILEDETAAQQDNVLPPELLLQIGQILSYRGHKRTLLNLASCNRSTLVLLIPLLYAEITFDQDTFGHQSRATNFLVDNLSLNKFTHTRHLQLRFPTQPDAELALLKACLPHLTQLDLHTLNPDLLTYLLSSNPNNNRAPNLKSLSFLEHAESRLVLPSILPPLPNPTFQIPPSVNFIHIGTRDPSAPFLISLLESYTNNEYKWEFQHIWHPHYVDFHDYPRAVSKLSYIATTIHTFHELRKVPGLLKLPRLRIDFGSGRYDLSELLEGLEVRELTAVAMETGSLLHGLPASLRRLCLILPRWTLKENEWSTVEEMLKKQGLEKLRLMMSGSTSGEREERERGWWRGLAGTVRGVELDLR